MIFIDLNTPPSPDAEPSKTQWSQDVEKIINRKEECSPQNPDPFNAIFFTNFSDHYQKSQERVRGETLTIVPFFSKFPLPSIDFSNMLGVALSNYGNIPHIE
jgi:hypothetical protein